MSLDSTAVALSITGVMQDYINGGSYVSPDPSLSGVSLYSAGAAEAARLTVELDNLRASGASPETIAAKELAIINLKGAGSYNMLDILAVIIDAGFQNAVTSETNLDISGVAGTLVFPPNQLMHTMIAKACADYWKAAKDPGTKVAYAISNVSNDAAKIEAPIAAGILGLRTGAYATPSYKGLIDVIYTEVMSIDWTVRESDSNGSATYIVSVS